MVHVSLTTKTITVKPNPKNSPNHKHAWGIINLSLMAPVCHTFVIPMVHFISQFYIFHGLPLRALNWNFYFGLYTAHSENKFILNSLWLFSTENWYKEQWSQVSLPPRPSHVVTVFSHQHTWESLLLWRLYWHTFRPLDIGEFCTVFPRKKMHLMFEKMQYCKYFLYILSMYCCHVLVKIWMCICTAETKWIVEL